MKNWQFNKFKVVFILGIVFFLASCHGSKNVSSKNKSTSDKTTATESHPTGNNGNKSAEQNPATNSENLNPVKDRQLPAKENAPTIFQEIPNPNRKP
ncbi:MAG: hypothetical protein LC115_04120 [Bacteroidia bacterium]|nr:hypothetical protein [Bacteroidia bacterium]